MANNRFGTITTKSLSVNGSSTLPNNQYHSTTNFPVSGASLYAWNLNGTSDFDGTAWNGGENLTEVGSVASGTDHLGNTSFNSFGAASSAYSTGTEFDATNESFTIGAWVKTSSTSAQYIMSKGNKAGSTTSFWFGIESSKYRFGIFDGSNAAHFIDTTVDALADGNWHFCCAQYNSTARTLSLLLDHKYVNHIYDVALNTRRNNSTDKLTVSGIEGNSSPGSQWNGSIVDAFYYKGVMTFDEMRQAGVIGSQKIGYLADRVHILGETNLGTIHKYLTADVTISNATSWFNADGLECYFPVNAEYWVAGQLQVIIDTAANWVAARLEYNNDDVMIPGTGCGQYGNPAQPNQLVFPGIRLYGTQNEFIAPGVKVGGNTGRIDNSVNWDGLMTISLLDY